jgi:hypothetical protein
MLDVVVVMDPGLGQPMAKADSKVRVRVTYLNNPALIVLSTTSRRRVIVVTPLRSVAYL